MIDTFFDCMNVCRCGQDVRSKKPALAPYRSENDWRFSWLRNDFLGFLDEWETECLTRPNLPMSEKRKMCLSRETLEGYRITVHSFVDLAKELLALDGVVFLLSEKFTQDPLEEYFSRQRGCLGRHENPTATEFGRNAAALHVAGAHKLLTSSRGNCHNNSS
ncbi:uncharacterized protein [Ptychodera flava]|uniref:uncharacterized protein n=1 Tax=Ptychodera flava TaxID=63121 RepID=UPI00396AB046